MNVKTNHGGVYLFYKSCYAIRRIQLPYRSMEVMAVYVHGVSVKLLFVVLYRPGSTTVCSPFFDDFADVVEHIVVYAGPTIIVGDVNIHLDDVSKSHTLQFNDILDGVDLVQHVAGPTHCTGHTLDVVIIQTATEEFVSVQPPSMSDRSLIVANIMPGHTIQSVYATIIKWKWTRFDVDKFEKELAESDLMSSPPTDCREYFTRYNKTLHELLDKHASLKSTVQRSRATAPWFNSLCRQVKVRTISLEKLYHATHSVTSYREWRIQSDVQRRVFQTTYTDYWSTAIESCSDSNTLW